jgi:hypothetical protein
LMGRPSRAARSFNSPSTEYSGFGIVKQSRTSLARAPGSGVSTGSAGRAAVERFVVPEAFVLPREFAFACWCRLRVPLDAFPFVEPAPTDLAAANASPPGHP